MGVKFCLDVVVATLFIFSVGYAYLLPDEFSQMVNSRRTYCEPDEDLHPCTCCRMRCWYDTRRLMGTLGVENPNDEAFVHKTLALISECSASACQKVCPKRARGYKMRPPWFQAKMAADVPMTE